MVFRDFAKSVQSVIDNQAPLKSYSRKQKTSQSKPWISNGVFTSIKRKQKLHQSHYLQENSAKRLHYKKYANLLTGVKKAAKALHYEHLLKITTTSFIFEECFESFCRTKKQLVRFPYQCKTVIDLPLRINNQRNYSTTFLMMWEIIWRTI